MHPTRPHFTGELFPWSQDRRSPAMTTMAQLVGLRLCPSVSHGNCTACSGKPLDSGRSVERVERRWSNFGSVGHKHPPVINSSTIQPWSHQLWTHFPLENWAFSHAIGPPFTIWLWPSHFAMERSTMLIFIGEPSISIRAIQKPWLALLNDLHLWQAFSSGPGHRRLRRGMLRDAVRPQLVRCGWPNPAPWQSNDHRWVWTWKCWVNKLWLIYG